MLVFQSNMADTGETEALTAAIKLACKKFKVPDLFPEQRNALSAFITGKDVLLNLPTGYGKSLVFQIAPEVRAELENFKGNNNSRPIVVVICPLISLMEDQEAYLKNIGIRFPTGNFARL